MPFQITDNALRLGLSANIVRADASEGVMPPDFAQYRVACNELAYSRDTGPLEVGPSLAS